MLVLNSGNKVDFLKSKFIRSRGRVALDLRGEELGFSRLLLISI